MAASEMCQDKACTLEPFRIEADKAGAAAGHEGQDAGHARDNSDSRTGLEVAYSVKGGWRRYRKAGNPTKPAKNPTTKSDKSRGLANVPEMNIDVS